MGIDTGARLRSQRADARRKDHDQWMLRERWDRFTNLLISIPHFFSHAQDWEGEAMSRRLVGTILLFLASEAIGLAYAEWSNRMFMQMIPPVALTTFNKNAAHVALLTSGAVLGLVIFVLSILSNWISGMFTPRASKAQPAKSVPAA